MSFPTKRRARRAAAYIAACCALLGLPVASCSDHGITEPTSRLSPSGASFSAALALNTRVVYLGAPNSQPINFIRARVYDESNATVGSVDQNLDPTKSAFDFSLSVQLPGARATKTRMTLELANRGAGGEIVQYSGRIPSLPLAPGDFRQVDIDLYPGPLDNFDVRGVRIAKPIHDIVEGDSVVATASVDGGSASTRIIWSSLDAATATIDNGGKIIGKASGTARVVAAVGTLADTASVKVLAKRAGIIITPANLEVNKVGDIGVYTATVVDKNGNAIPNEPVLWSIADQAIGSFVSTATVQGMRVGQTTVTARAANDTAIRGTATFRVKPQDARVARLDVSPSAATLRTLGTTQAFVATARDSAGNVVPNVLVSWSSSASNIATVSPSGVATAVARGATSIIATLDTLSGRASLVVDPSASDLKLVGGDAQTDTVGHRLAQPFAVRTVDRAGNPVGGVPVQFSAADGASLSVANTTSNNEGVAQTQVTLGRTPGAYHVSARADSLAGSPITVSATAVSGAPYALEIERQPSSPAQNRVALSTQPIVRVVDAFGNRALRATPTITATPDSGSIAGNSATVVAATGLATYSTMSLGGRLGDRNITFSSGQLIPVTARVTLVAGAPASIAAVSGATQVGQAGTAVSTIPSVRVLDADGNPVAGATVTFAVTAGNGSVTNVTVTTDANGVASAGGWTLGTGAGTNTLTATVGNLSTTFTATATAGTPSSTGSTMNVSATTITAGAATPITVTIQLRDGNGNALTTSGGVVTIASTLGTVSSVVDNGNGSYTATLTAPQTTGTALLTAALGGQPLTSSATVTIQPGAPSATTTTVGVGSTSLNANGTTTITITVRDAYGNIVTNVTPSGIALSSSIGTIGTVTCTNGVCTATYTAPASSGTAAIGVSVGGTPVTSAPSIAVSAVPGVVTGITATPGNAQVSLGWTAPSNGGSPITNCLIEYSIDGVTWTTFAHAPSTATNIVVTGLANGTAYRFRVSAVNAIGTSAPSSPVNATPTAGGTPQLAVNGGNSQTAVAGTAVANAPSVKAFDANNNPVQGVSVTFSVASGGGSVTGATTTTDAGGIATVGGWTLGTTAGANSLTASASGYASATINATGTVGAASATTSTVSASPTSLTANGSATSTLTVRLKDANGNNLTTGGATVTFATPSAGSIGPVTDNNDGTYSATYTAGSAAGNVTIQPKLGGTSFTNTATIGLTAGTATQLVLTTSASGSASGAAFTTQPVVQIRDASNVLVGGSTANVTMSVSSNGAVVGTSTVAAINGVATFTNVGISGTAGMSYTLTFASAGLTSATQLITPRAGAPDASQTTLSVGSTTLNANGTATVTVTIMDAFGNVVTTATPSVFTLATDVGSIGTVSCTNGVCTATFTAPSIAGPANISAKIGGTSVSGSPVAVTVASVAGAPTALAASAGAAQVALSWTAPASNGGSPISDYFIEYKPTAGSTWSAFSHTASTTTAITVTGLTNGTSYDFRVSAVNGVGTGGASSVASATPTAGGTPHLTVNGGNNQTATSGSAVATAPSVKATDANNNPVSGLSVTFAIASGGGSVSGGSATTDASGIATVGSWTLGTTAGANSLTVSASGYASTTVNATGLVGVASTTTSSVSASPTSLTANGSATSTITVRLKDANGNNLTTGGASVTFATPSAGSIGGATDNNDGTYTATYTAGSIAGSVTIQPKLGGTNLTNTATISLTVGSATQLYLSTNASGAASGTAFSTQPVVQIRDAGNNVVTGSTASVTMSVNANGTTLGTATVTAVNGVATFTDVGISGTAGTSYTLTFASSGLTSTTQGITPTAGAPSVGTSTLSVGSTSLNASGTTTITVTVKDASGNVVTAATPSSFTLATDLGSIGMVSCTNGVCTATFTAPNGSGTATITAKIGGLSLSGSPATVTVASVGGAPASLGATPGAAQVSLSWTAPSSNGGASITDYMIEYKPSAGATWTAFNHTASTATAAVVTGLTNGTSYDFRVSAVNSVGTGSPSPVATATPTAGATPQLAVNGGNNQTAVAGSAVATAPSVKALDANSNPVQGVSVTFSVASGNGSITGGSATTDASGIATIGSWTLGTTAGANSLTASASGYASATINATGTVGAASATTSTVSASPTSLTANGSATSTLTVRLKDANGNNLTTGGASVTFATPSAGSVGSVTDNNDGTYSATYTAGSTPGTVTIQPKLGGTNFTNTAAISLSVGAAAELALSTNASGAASGAAFTTQPVVQIRDASHNVVTSSTANVTMTVDNGGTIVGTSTVAAVSGVATFTNVGIAGTAGSTYTLTFASTGLTSTTQSIAPTAGAPSASTSALSVGSTGLSTGGTTTITVTVKDAFGNVVTTATPSSIALATDLGSIGTVSCTNGVCTATFTAPGSNGTANISAKIGGTSIQNSPVAVTIANVAGAPTGLAATSNQSAQVPLTWTAPASNGGSAITNYLLEYSANGGTSWSTFAHTASTATSITVTGLTNGTLYTFRVSAINGVGTGTASATATATPVGAPDAPTNLVATPGTAQAALSWSAPANNGGASITDYVIEYSSNGGTSWTTFSHTPSAATSATITGLTNGTTYTFRVSAVNANGTGAASTTTTGTPGAPGAPTSLGVALNQVSATSHTGSLTWTAPASNGGAAITDYVIEYKKQSTSTWTVVSHTAQTTTSYSITGLVNSTAYDFRVAAKNSVGTGPYSAIASGTTTGPSERLQCQTNGNSNSNSTTASVLPCSSVNVGDIIVIPVAITNGGTAKTITSADGFTALPAVQNNQDSQNQFQTTVFYKIATSADVGRATAYGFSWTGTEKSIITLVAYKNVDSSAPSITSATGMSATMTAPTGPDMTAQSHTLLYFYLQNIALSSTTPSISEWGMTTGSSNGPSDLFKNTTAGANNANAIGVLTADIDKFTTGATSTVEKTTVTANSSSKSWTAIVLGIHP